MLITKHIFCQYGGLIANLLQNHNNPFPGKQAEYTPCVGIILFKKWGVVFLKCKKKYFAGFFACV